MITLDDFVKSLGDFASGYTPEQLQLLHRDVQRFAQVIIEIQRAKERQRTTASPQQRLDASCSDRTLDAHSSHRDHDAVERVITMAWRAQLESSTKSK